MFVDATMYATGATPCSVRIRATWCRALHDLASKMMFGPGGIPTATAHMMLARTAHVCFGRRMSEDEAGEAARFLGRYLKIENACNGFRAKAKANESKKGSFEDIDPRVLQKATELDAADFAANGNRGCFVLLAEGTTVNSYFWPKVEQLGVPVHAFKGEAHRAIVQYYKDCVGEDAIGLSEGDVRAVLPGRGAARSAVLGVDDSSAASVVFGEKRFFGKQEQVAQRAVTVSNLARVFYLGEGAMEAQYLCWAESPLHEAVRRTQPAVTHALCCTSLSPSRPHHQMKHSYRPEPEPRRSETSVPTAVRTLGCCQRIA